MYEILLRLIPTKKVHFGQRVLSMTQDESGVTIHTSDNLIHKGDILVGADGAYSGVRQSLYQTLKKDGKLPLSDSEHLSFKYVSLVAQTEPLDPEEFPELKREDSPFQCTVGDNKYSVKYQEYLCFCFFNAIKASYANFSSSFKNHFHYIFSHSYSSYTISGQHSRPRRTPSATALL